jgi:hypothetical protein
MMDVEMNPPRSIVIVEMMIPVPRIYAERERIGSHEVER